MNHSEVVDRLASSLQWPPIKVRQAIRQTADALKHYILEEKRITLPTLGTFGIKQRKSRTSFNPHSRVYMKIPKKNVVVFHPAKRLKEEMKDERP